MARRSMLFSSLSKSGNGRWGIYYTSSFKQDLLMPKTACTEMDEVTVRLPVVDTSLNFYLVTATQGLSASSCSCTTILTRGPHLITRSPRDTSHMTLRQKKSDMPNRRYLHGPWKSQLTRCAKNLTI